MNPHGLLALTFALLTLPQVPVLARLKTTVPDRPSLPISTATPPPDPLQAATMFDLLAACLRSGLPMDTATRAVIPSAPAELAQILRQAGDLMRLGSDPITAWESATKQEFSNRPRRRTDENDPIAALARTAARSARSGTSVAEGISELAVQHRSAAIDVATARSQRAGVLLAGPLGLCFLPAFLCLGIVPVVAGLLGRVLGGGPL